MELGEKLQELRKGRGLTQEELAESLFVSRTAISKWESGRGYPSIDSLKELSRFFSVSIDELLSSEKLITIAEKENKSNIQRLCSLFFGIIDLCAVMLIFLPLYPDTDNSSVYSVNLIAYTEITELNRLIYWILFSAIIISGIANVALTQLKITKGQKAVTCCSMILSAIAVIILGIAREPYAVTVVFGLLSIKALLIFKQVKAEN